MPCHMPCAFLRLSHSLQYCGHFIPAGIRPAALSDFQSAPQARSRATMAWRAADPVAGLAAVVGAGAAEAGAEAGAGAVAVGAAVPPDMHCLVKSRYFIVPVWFAAFILSHSAAHSFMVLACAGPTPAASTTAKAAAVSNENVFMTKKSPSWGVDAGPTALC